MNVFKGIFVTGTDTGVGKTVVAAGLLKAARQAGRDAVPMKPVQTGCRRSREGWRAPDLAHCLKTAGLTVEAPERRLMSPYCFGPACSPHLAAAETNVTISLAPLQGAFRRLAARHAWVVVEGAGGVMVPLGPKLSMLDLMRRLGLPVVLVARPGLGTLNHTFLSLDALRQAGVPVVGVIVNAALPGRWGRIERDNVRTLERQGSVPVLGCIRHGGSAARQEQLFGAIFARVDRRVQVLAGM